MPLQRRKNTLFERLICFLLFIVFSTVLIVVAVVCDNLNNKIHQEENVLPQEFTITYQDGSVEKIDAYYYTIKRSWFDIDQNFADFFNKSKVLIKTISGYRSIDIIEKVERQ
jgi:hypothetical protein